MDELALHIHGTHVERDRMKKRRLHRSDLLLRTLPRLAGGRHRERGCDLPWPAQYR
ncbi:hypothetical protein [uncultured Azohydromonas sp.]|uniref:hypothetical protein n=1 Tax=uncultured Azohydromonas sp. TaxID=487342 RepID=UPI002604DD34|nr:hypothetical protein [uncultured Azohydromonas sp.]